MTFWRDKVVVITGGSAGLGLVLAGHWARAGARVVLLARDQQRLDSARELVQQGAALPPLGFSVDLTQAEQTQTVIDRIQRELGRIDVLVNCAGASTRHALAETAPALFQKQLEQNFMTAVNCTQAALPHLLAARGQVIVVASLAGRTAWPLVGAYVTSKSALVAYAAQLRLELGDRLRVLTVLPGPIQRSNETSRYQAEAERLPERALQPGAGAPVKGLDPDRLAKEILSAAERGQIELVRPWKVSFLFQLQALFPKFGLWLLRRLTR
ncbi:MAG: SDR family NAD(P)-dependent oxidoreductase [Planctomycetota bacterium]